MKILKSLSIITGMVALTFGINSCEKEDSNECCTLTRTYEDITETITACEDGSATVSYGDETDTYSWKDGLFDSWSEIRSLVLEYGGTCSK